MTIMTVAPDGAVKPLFSAEDIAGRIDQLARDIAAAKLHDLIIVAVLKGSFVFAADLVRALQRVGLSPEIDFIYLASYDGATDLERRRQGAARRRQRS